MTTTIRITEPRELLALVPHQIGFTPTESVVAISLRPPRGRVGLVARVDLAGLVDPDDGSRVARGLIGHLDRDGARSVLLVVYTAADPRSDREHPAWLAVRRLRAAGSVLGDFSVWVVAETGYLNLDCEESCCPPGGRPLSELQSTEVGARMVVAGSVVADRRQDVAAIASASGEDRRTVARVCARWAVRGAEAASAGPKELELWRIGGLEAWRREVARVQGDATSRRGAATGRVEAALRDIRVRDAVLVAMLPGVGELPDQVVRGATTSDAVQASLASALDQVYDGRTGVRPPAGPTAVHVRVLEQVVAHGRAHRQAPACTLLAMLAWWSGEGARAALLLDRALDDDPDHRLARLLHHAVAGGLPPGWARSSQ